MKEKIKKFMKKNLDNIKKMDKKRKYTLLGVIVVVIIVLLFLIDFISIGVRNKPIFASTDSISEGNIVYKGLFYNTHYCFDEDNAYIKGKGSKFTCSKEINEDLVYGKIISVGEETVVIEVTEETNSLKVGDTAEVKIGEELLLIGSNKLFEDQIIKIRPELINESYPVQINTSSIGIISNSVEISIEYSKDRELEEKMTINNSEDDNYVIYYLGIDKMNVKIYNDTYELSEVLLNNITSLNNIITKLSYIGEFDEDTPYIIDTSARMYKAKDFTIIKCNYINEDNGYVNQNLYVGDKNMEYEESYCQ